MNCIIIYRIAGFDMPGYSIRAEIDGVRLSNIRFYGYNKREAIREYRVEHGLRYKKLVKVEY